MRLESKTVANGQRIPVEYALGGADPKDHIYFADNRNPDLSWSEYPPEAKSFALICVDPDVPSEGTEVNKVGHSVPASLHRVPGYLTGCLSIFRHRSTTSKLARIRQA